MAAQDNTSENGNSFVHDIEAHEDRLFQTVNLMFIRFKIKST